MPCRMSAEVASASSTSSWTARMVPTVFSIAVVIRSIASWVSTSISRSVWLSRARGATGAAPSPEPEWTPAVAAEADALHEVAAVRTRSFVLEGREITGKRMDMSRIDEVVHVGDTEIWEVHSSQPIPHSFHIHDVQFRILTVDGSAPPPQLAGPKDTVYLMPNVRYRLLVRFEDYTDPALPYMYHCHMLLHEDEGMMGQFVVIEPGQEDQVRVVETRSWRFGWCNGLEVSGRRAPEARPTGFPNLRDPPHGSVGS